MECYYWKAKISYFILDNIAGQMKLVGSISIHRPFGRVGKIYLTNQNFKQSDHCTILVNWPGFLYNPCLDLTNFYEIGQVITSNAHFQWKHCILTFFFEFENLTNQRE